MKIVCISDTHMKHDRLIVPDGDVLIHCGDICFSRSNDFRGQIDDINIFIHWLKSLPHKHKILVAGNHDVVMEEYPLLADKMLQGITYLRDEAVTIDGITFYGTPWQPIFGHWGFNRSPEILKIKYAEIPMNVDVLITHCPPLGVLDMAHNEYCGSYELLSRVTETKPRYHVFGHIHENGERAQKGARTIFVNCSVLDNEYNLVYEPMEFEI